MILIFLSISENSSSVTILPFKISQFLPCQYGCPLIFFRVIFYLILFLQAEQAPLWTQIIPPHFLHVHLDFSFLINSLIPLSAMHSKFSIMLIPYLPLYLLSRSFNLLQGYFSHFLEQNSHLFSFKISQFLIMHLLQDLIIAVSLHPGQWFFSRKYAMHNAQFIPHGAII